MRDREEEIQSLVEDCIIAHQEIILVKLIAKLEKEYKELAKLATFGEYKDSWTHNELLDFVTYET
jgi:hypothetical protein